MSCALNLRLRLWQSLARADPILCLQVFFKVRISIKCALCNLPILGLFDFVKELTGSLAQIRLHDLLPHLLDLSDVVLVDVLTHIDETVPLTYYQILTRPDRHSTRLALLRQVFAIVAFVTVEGWHFAAVILRRRISLLLLNCLVQLVGTVDIYSSTRCLFAVVFFIIDA